LLSRDVLIFNHDFSGVILDDLIIIIEETCGESFRVVDLILFSQLGLRSCQLKRIEASNSGIILQDFVLLLAEKFDILNVELHEGSESDHIENITADLRNHEIVNRENDIQCLEPDPHKDSRILVMQLRVPLNDFPIESKTVFGLKIFVIAFQGVNAVVRNYRSFLEFPCLRFFPHFFLC
jgi:hypothetical protein